MYERNDIERIVDNDGILWLNKKHIEEGLAHKNLWEIITKYHSDRKNHGYELVDYPKKQVNTIFIDEKLARLIVETKLTVEVYENGHCNRNIDYEIKRAKAIEQELDCQFIRIDPDEEQFDIFKIINKILSKTQLKTTLINKIPTRLLGLEVKSDKKIKCHDIYY